MAWQGTVQERQRWAIKKRREADAAARQKGAETLPGYEIAPDQHRCDERTIEGYEVPPSQTRCKVCGRTWTYAPTKSGWLSVTVTPLSEKQPPEKVVPGVGTELLHMPPADLQGAERGAWWAQQQRAA